jgi:hydroxymethylbilane synthase
MQTMVKRIRVGSRASKMAQYQTDTVIEKLRVVFPGFELEKVLITTDADTHDRSLRNDGGKGAFVRALDLALLTREIDIAVNCLKDIPNSHERLLGIVTAGVLERDELHDVAITKTGVLLKDLLPGSSVGTVAPRRIAQVGRHFPLLKCVHFRGSADTRISKLDAGDVDAIILASSGLRRIGLISRVTEVLPLENFVPPIGAGVVTIDCLDERDDLKQLIQQLSDTETMRCVIAERSFLDSIQGSCNTALAGYAWRDEGGRISMHAVVYSSSGKDMVHTTQSCIDGEEVALGRAIAMTLIANGARDIML